MAARRPPLVFGALSFLILLFSVASAILIIKQVNHVLTFLLITGFGALGGILHATRNRRIEIPHPDLDGNSRDGERYFLGYWTDILDGIAGAYVIFLLLPDSIVDPNNLMDHLFATDKVTPLNTITKSLPDSIKEFQYVRELFRIIAISLVGGYTGRALMEKIQTDLLQVKKDLEGVKAQQLESLQLEERKSKLMQIVSEILDFHHPPSANTIKDLNHLTKEASPELKSVIFYTTKAKRQDFAIRLINMLKEAEKTSSDYKSVIGLCESDPVKKTQLSRIANFMQATQHIFEALKSSALQSDDPLEARLQHRCLAHLAYTRKDHLIASNKLDSNGDWNGIAELLSEAIQKRDKAIDSTMEERDDNYGFYELNLAICYIMTDGNFQSNRPSSRDSVSKIQALLSRAEAAAAHRGDPLEGIFPIKFWRKLNHIRN